MSLADAERIKYLRVWEDPSYRKADHSSEVWFEYCGEFARRLREIRVIDLGCGVGRLVGNINRSGGYACGVDIAENSVGPEILGKWSDRFSFCALWAMPVEWLGEFDVGICADVMEHIPESMVLKSFHRIVEVCRTAFFLIESVLDHAGRMGDDPLHLTVKPEEWWVAEAEKVGTVTVLPRPRRVPRETPHYIRLDR